MTTAAANAELKLRAYLTGHVVSSPHFGYTTDGERATRSTPVRTGTTGATTFRGGIFRARQTRERLEQNRLQKVSIEERLEQ